jgi:hypothetical protein
MSTQLAAQIIKDIKERVRDRPELEKASQALGDAISVGNISNSTGVAIGSNIRMVINQLNLPAEHVAALLNLRTGLGSSLGLEPDRYGFGDLLIDKTHGFVGREYVFSAIDEFLTRNSKGYFVVEADPGMGKSSVLAEYVRRTGCICHFNVRAIGLVNARQFLESVCTQLIVDRELPYPTLPADAGQDGTRLARLLQEAASRLPSGERLVIAVDALDEAELSGHPVGANVLWLPRNLPEHVYFILTRRNVDLPFVVEGPQQTLKLLKYPDENRKDIELHIARSTKRQGIKSWIANQKDGMTTGTFITRLADLSDNNFMYLHHVIHELEIGAYQTFTIERLPLGLQGYYEDHWHRMGMTAKPVPRTKIRIIYVMCEVRQAVSRTMVSQFATDSAVQADELTVQEVLDEWKQFLHQQHTSEGMRYSIYHASFRDFLHRKEIVQAAGITIKQINALIANSLWESVFSNSSS